ncbi:hypothetical protein PHYPSEUDO_008331 [Phytophthora pseudosyringae]|uniref:Uncharacterized protein n=1 Tax=Phytophthora pseudosyringae TaxID=221518 RepID=A0A8T1VHL6_9STRA|nr:hypothetical protein PHYPSEUDO_008331 [Phytophthora pseudosyringae]
MCPGCVEEGDGFVVEQASFTVVPPTTAGRKSNPRAPTEPTEPLSELAFVVVWLLLLAFHGLCAAYLLAMAMLYFFMENPLMAYYTNLLALPEHRYFRLFGILVGMLGALHGLQLVLHLLWSIKARTPAVFPRAAMTLRVVKFFQGLKKTKTRPVESTSSRSRSSISSISAFTTAGLQDMLSVEGNHFALVFLVRKAVEAGAQIVQCHRYSTLIGRVWINHAYAAMVVVNCWVTPLLDYLMLASDSRATKKASTRNVVKEIAAVSIRERTICVTVDTLMAMMACLVLPLAIFVPYVQVFDASWYGFPMEILYGDVSFPNLIRENQALFALTFVDAVTKLVPHLSILFGMASISLILELHSPRSFRRRGRIVSAGTSLVVAQGKPRDSKALTGTVSKRGGSKPVVGLTFLRRVGAPLCFVAAGAAILGLHLHAAHLANRADSKTMAMCLQGLRPWFAENVSCSVLEYSCHSHGVLTPPGDALDHLQSDAVTAIVFEHCTEFEMPPSILRFRNLLGLELWNVSIAKWGEDAALNARLHPDMIYLVMVYTNMTEMPQGLLTIPLPPLLGDIEISITNLTVIPDELAVAWSNVRLVYLEHTPLEAFPTALFKIPSLSVSLLDDGLETIPDDLFTTVSLLDEYLEVCFSYNPIKELPSSIREGLLINYLSIDHTELTELPAWVDDVGQWINLGGCLVCNDTDPKVPGIAGCTDWGWDPMVDGRYPLALVAPLREIN